MEFRPLEFCEIFTIYKLKGRGYNLIQDRLIFPADAKDAQPVSLV